MDEEKRKRISYNAVLSRWKKLKALAGERECTIQHLIDEALDVVYFSATSAHVCSPTPIRERYAEEHAQLDIVLDSPFPDLPEALRANLKGWSTIESLLEGRQPRPAGKKIG